MSTLPLKTGSIRPKVCSQSSRPRASPVDELPASPARARWLAVLTAGSCCEHPPTRTHACKMCVLRQLLQERKVRRGYSASALLAAVTPPGTEVRSHPVNRLSAAQGAYGVRRCHTPWICQCDESELICVV